jgi:hypothetical protein
MQLSSLISSAGLELSRVAVMFHVSDKQRLNSALARLAEEEPELFDAFQNQHGPNIEATLVKRSFIASFVTFGNGDYVFAGVFAIDGWSAQTWEQLDADPRRQELQRRYGDTSFVALGRTQRLNGRRVFNLVRHPAMQELIGRLRVKKPPKAARNYRFLAENLDCPIVEITRHRHMVPPPPDWRAFVLTADEVRSLPRDWAARLREWRGVYLIIDQRDRMHYVGSAYGADNILTRWKAHVAGDKGVTKELALRDPAGFRFSILERTSPDLDKEAVIALEQSWKRRLDTLEHGLNRN